MVSPATLLTACAVGFLVVGKDDAPGLYARSLRLHMTSLSVDTIRVLRAGDIALPARIGQRPVLQQALPLALLGGKPSTRVVKVLPLQVRNGELVVVLVDYAASRVGEDVRLEWEGSETFRYRYNPAKKSYQLAGRQHGTL